MSRTALLAVALGLTTIVVPAPVETHAVAAPERTATPFPTSGGQVRIGDGGPAVEAMLEFPTGVAVHGSDLYVTEQRGHRVRRVDLSTGTITTVAGTGEAGFAGDGGPATEALLHQPENITVDRDGNLFIGDLQNHRIRRVDAATGRISTIAGTGEDGFTGDGGPATQAAISNPFGLVVHPDGDLYFADTENHRIRRIDAASGVVTTVAGTGRRGFGGDGGPATEAMLSRPHVLAVHPGGDIIIGDSFNQRIRRLDLRTGVIRTIAGTGEQGTYGDGGPASQAAFVFFGELAVDPRGRLILSGVGNHTVRVIDLDTGTIDRVAGTGRWAFGGDGGPALQADFHLPYGLDVDDEGNVYVADFWNWRVRRIDAGTNTVTTVAGGVLPPEGTEHYHFHFDEPR